MRAKHKWPHREMGDNEVKTEDEVKAEAVKSEVPEDDELKRVTLEILGKTKLEELTKKTVRRSVEKELGRDPPRARPACHPPSTVSGPTPLAAHQHHRQACVRVLAPAIWTGLAQSHVFGCVILLERSCPASVRRRGATGGRGIWHGGQEIQGVGRCRWAGWRSNADIVRWRKLCVMNTVNARRLQTAW